MTNNKITYIFLNTKKIDKLEINRTVFIITNIYNNFLFENRTDPHIISIDEYNKIINEFKENDII